VSADDPIVLANFVFPDQAQLARLALEAKGVPCYLLETNQAGHGGFGLLFPVRLMILPEDREAAIRILREEGLYEVEEK
jgi:acetyl esterase/lipase